MDRFDRIYLLHKLLAARRTPIARRDLEQRLECSRATVLRAIADLRSHLGAPVEYDRERNGYFLDARTKPLFELPGLWFTPDEVHALLATHQLLSRVQPGLLEPEIGPLRERIGRILQHRHAGDREVLRRIRILQMAPRAVDIDTFRAVAGALMRRQRLHVLYHGRARDETTERRLSPQRLVYYRDNWYLDAWCHLRQDLRSFSLDRLHVVGAEGRAKDMDEARLDRHFTTAYGIFAGTPKHTATLRFTSSAARWVADEQWHPNQTSTVLDDGGLELRVPYSDPRELVMDILKYGPDVEVIAPVALRREVADRIADTAARYAVATEG